MRFNTVLLLFYKLMYIAVCCTLLCLNVKCLAPAIDLTNKSIVSILLLFVQLGTSRTCQFTRKPIKSGKGLPINCWLIYSCSSCRFECLYLQWIKQCWVHRKSESAPNVMSQLRLQLTTKQMFLCGSYFIVCRYCLNFERAWEPMQVFNSQLLFQTAALQMVSVNRWCQSAPWKWNSEHPELWPEIWSPH